MENLALNVQLVVKFQNQKKNMKNIQILYLKKIKKIKKIQGIYNFKINLRKIFIGFLTKSNFKSFMDTGVYIDQETISEEKNEEDELKSYVLLPEEFKYKQSNVNLFYLI